MCAVTFPPPGWYLMLSVDPILERTFLMSGAGVELGRVAGVRAVVLAVVELGRGTRGTSGFFSAAAAVVLLEAGVLVGRGRAVALLVVVEALSGADLERAASETRDVRLANYF